MPSFASSRAFPLLSVASLLFATTTTAIIITEANTELCGQFQAVSTKDEQYIFNNNAWGEDDSGAQCTDVLESGASFESIWSWTANGNDTHSFPNVQLNTALFPLALSDLAAMNLQASWSMTQEDGLDGATRANVVYDMFFDSDKTTSGNATTAKYEMMIWIGAFNEPFPLGASVNPFGVVNNSLPGVVVGNTNFTLFSGENDGGQTVHSWLSTGANITDFSGDAAPLVEYLTTNKLVESGQFLGLLQFGTETWHATSNVTFSATSFNLNVTSTDKSANAKASSAVAFQATATSTSGSSPSASVSSVLSSSPSDSLSSSSPSQTGAPSSSGSTSSAGSTATGSSGSSSSGTSSGSSPSGSSSGSSGSSSISLPFWFWEIAAAGCLFAMF